MQEIRLCDNSHIEITAKLCKKYNLGIEYQDFSKNYIHQKKELKRRCAEANLIISKGKSMHAQFKNLNPGALDKSLQAKALHAFNLAYHTAQEIGASELIFHNGMPITQKSTKEWEKRASEFWSNALLNQNSNITICLENQFEKNPEIIKNIIDTVNNKSLLACLDIGHANCFSNFSVEEWINCLEKRIKYFHLHNNHGKNKLNILDGDEHLGIENGTINIQNVLKLAISKCPNSIWGVEVRDDDVTESIETLRHFHYLK